MIDMMFTWRIFYAGLVLLQNQPFSPDNHEWMNNW